jgi:hypothetical protein
VAIGIAVSGRNAGLAIVRALQAVERIAEGAVGGFVSLVVIGTDGDVHRAAIQRGCMVALFPADAPAAIGTARRAAVISSGPDRPEPLARFAAADGAVGLVTGHRFPHQPGEDGVPINEAVLACLRRGLAPAAAVRQVLSANPLADAGVIALGRNGRIAFGNTALVSWRPDVKAVRLPAGHYGAAQFDRAWAGRGDARGRNRSSHNAVGGIKSYGHPPSWCPCPAGRSGTSGNRE